METMEQLDLKVEMPTQDSIYLNQASIAHLLEEKAGEVRILHKGENQVKMVFQEKEDLMVLILFSL